MKNKEGRVFDYDGVIADSMENLHWKYISSHIPEITFEEWMKLSDGNYWEEAEKSVFAADLAAIKNKPDFNEYIKNHITVPLYKGVPELIGELKQAGYKTGLNTSGSDEQVLKCLDYNHLRYAFDFLGTKDVSISKEEKMIMFTESQGIEIENIIFIFDTVGDWKEVQKLQENHGLITVAVTYGLHSRCHLENHIQPTYFVDSVEELKALIL